MDMIKRKNKITSWIEKIFIILKNLSNERNKKGPIRVTHIIPTLIDHIMANTNEKKNYVNCLISLLIKWLLYKKKKERENSFPLDHSKCIHLMSLRRI